MDGHLSLDKTDAFQSVLMHKLNEEGLSAMTDHCLQLDLNAGRSPLRSRLDIDPSDVRRSARQMLGSMVPEVLLACVTGKVAAAMEFKDSPVAKELGAIEKRDEVTPSTYGNFFTDAIGMSPTPAQLEQVLVAMRRYRSHSPSRDIPNGHTR